MDKKEQTKLRVQRYRNKQKSVTRTNSVTLGDVTQEMVPVAYVQGLNGRMYQSLPEKPRFVTLSDGQVFDRANQPLAVCSGGFMIRMQACNEGMYNFHPNEGRLSKKLRDSLT